MPVTNYFANAVLASLSANNYLALHTADPTYSGLSTTEVSGASYARLAITYTVPANRSMSNTGGVQFLNLPSCTVTFLAVWSSLNGGNCVYTLPLPTPMSVNYGGNITIPANDIYLSLS